MNDSKKNTWLEKSTSSRVLSTTSTGKILANISAKPQKENAPLYWGKLELAIIFDSTASMSPIILEVKNTINNLISEIKKRVPNTKLGLVGYRGDCNICSCLEKESLTSDVEKIISLVESINIICSSCWYSPCDKALQEINQWYWSSNTIKILIIIGDARTHNINDCPSGINWQEEAVKIKSKSISTYSVWSKSGAESEYQEDEKFFRELANISGGKFIDFNQLNPNDIADLIMAICMKETGQLNKYLTTETQKRSLLKQISFSKITKMLTSGS